MDLRRKRRILMKILVDVNICSDIPTSNQINGHDYMHIWRLPLESKGLSGITLFPTASCKDKD